MTATASFRVTLNGSPLPEGVADLLVEAYVDDSLALPDLFALTFADPQRSVIKDGGFEIGGKVSIAVTQDSAAGTKLISEAEITALEAEADPAGSFTIVRGLDRSHRLMSGRITEVYKNSSYSDIVRKVASRTGLSTGSISETSPVFDHVAQGNTSDWQFLWRMAREVGFEVKVADGKLDFAPPPVASDGPPAGNLQSTNHTQLILGENLRRFRSVVTSAEQVGEVTVRSWDPKQKRELIGTAPAKTAAASLGATTPASLAAKFGNAKYVSVGVPYASQGECEHAAKAIAEEIASSFAAFDGLAVGNTALRAGVAVSLGQAGPPFDGKYTLATTRHVYDHEGYSTWFTVSGSQDRSILGLASGGSAGGGSSPAGGAIAGVVPGIVTNAGDPENLGRVKIKLPWLSDAYESDWVRTVQMWAGKGYGSLVAPEVGDEVLVAFEFGDLRRPYVVGGLYNGQDTPFAGDIPLVDASSGKVNKRQLASRTGHVLVFEDKEGTNDGIFMQTSDAKHALKLSKNGRTVTLLSDGSIQITCTGAPGDITIKADGNLELSGRQIKITGQAGVTIDAGSGQLSAKGMQVAVEGQAQAGFKSSGVLQIQGTLVKIN
jgi:phage protein D/phage baseplate assembly protein gpV